jgi:hypothetical protein
MYALKSSEARRQYPRRLKLFFDYVGLRGTLNEQEIEFLKRLKEDSNSQQDNLLRFLYFHKERVRRKELAAGTNNLLAQTLLFFLLRHQKIVSKSV